jgi:hypothetical protein
VSIWVAILNISQATASKISQRGITADDVWDALLCVIGLTGVWDYDSDRGKRAIVRFRFNDQIYIAVLYPVEDNLLGGEWNLGSVYKDSRRQKSNNVENDE